MNTWSVYNDVCFETFVVIVSYKCIIAINKDLEILLILQVISTKGDANVAFILSYVSVKSQAKSEPMRDTYTKCHLLGIIYVPAVITFKTSLLSTSICH